MANYRANSFFEQTKTNLGNATQLLGYNYDMSTTPYYSFKYHASSLLYPIAHAAHAIRDLLKVAEGGLLLIHALFNQPLSSIPTVLQGIGVTLASCAVNCLNTAMSLISFVSRSLSTLFSLGYSSSIIANAFNNGINGREVGGRNYESTARFVAGIGLGFVGQVLGAAEEHIMTTTLSI